MSPYFHPQDELENKIQLLVSETKGSSIFGGDHEYRLLKLFQYFSSKPELRITIPQAFCLIISEQGYVPGSLHRNISPMACMCLVAISVLQKEKSSGHLYLWWTLTLSHTDSLIALSSVCSCTYRNNFCPVYNIRWEKVCRAALLTLKSCVSFVHILPYA